MAFRVGCVRRTRINSEGQNPKHKGMDEDDICTV